MNQVFKKTALASMVGLSCYGMLAHAARFTVTNTDDTGAGSLRQAIADANANPGPDDIDFDPALDGMPIVLDGTIGITGLDSLVIIGRGQGNTIITNPIDTNIFDSSTGGELSISDLSLDTMLVGVSGARIGLVQFGSGGLTVSDVSLANTANLTRVSPLVGVGGALSVESSRISGLTDNLFVNDGDIRIVDSVFDNNSHSAFYGGVISHYGDGDLYIEDSIFSNNTTSLSLSDTGAMLYRDANGSGTTTIISSSFIDNDNSDFLHPTISVVDDISISDSVFSGNTGASVDVSNTDSFIKPGAVLTVDSSLFMDNSNSNSFIGNGGIIRWPADLSIANSSFINNTTTVGGALTIGRALASTSQTATIVNTTFSGNTAMVEGGAINISSGASNNVDLDILNSTFLDNEAPRGKALFVDAMVNSPTIVNSILASTASQGGESIVEGAVDVDFSLVGVSAGATINELTPGNSVFDTDPLLLPLADNGGKRIGANADQALLTHVIQEGSSVVNAGDQNATNSSIALPTTDQRGAGFMRILAGGIDMGATEGATALPTPSSSGSSGGGGGSSSLGLLGLLGLLFSRKIWRSWGRVK